MRIYFVRHGESRANLLHEIANRGLRHGLTRKGREQAGALARRLRELPITRIYSSPLLRAIETSVIVANRLTVEYEITDALREFDCGLLEGRSDEGAWEAWQELFDAWVVRHEWARRIEGGESFHDVLDRFRPFIDGLVQRHGNTGAEVACVGHGGVYHMMLPVVLKNVNTEVIAQHGLAHATCIVAEWSTGGLSCVEWHGHVVDVPPGSSRAASSTSA